MNNSFVNPIELLNLVSLKPDEITKEVIKKAKRIVIADVELSDHEEINFKGVTLTVVDVEYYATLLSKENNIKLYSDLLKFEAFNEYLYGGSLEELVQVIKRYPQTVENFQLITAVEFKDVFLERTKESLQKLYRYEKYSTLLESLYCIESFSKEYCLFLMHKLYVLLELNIEILSNVSSELRTSTKFNSLEETINDIEEVVNSLPPDLIEFFDKRFPDYDLANSIVTILINLSVFLHNTRKRTNYALKSCELGERYSNVDSELWKLNWSNKKVYLEAINSQKKKRGTKYGFLVWLAFWILAASLRNVQCNNNIITSHSNSNEGRTARSNAEYSKVGKVSPEYARNMYENVSYMNLPYSWSSGGIDLSFPLPNFFHSGIDEKRTYFIKVNQNWSWNANQSVLNTLISLDKRNVKQIKIPRSVFPDRPESGDSPFDLHFNVKTESKVKTKNELQGRLVLVNVSNYDQVIVFYKAESMKPVRSCYLRNNDSTTISLKEYYYSICTMSGVNWINDCVRLDKGKVGGFSNLLTFHQFNPVYLFVSEKKSKKSITRIRFRSPEQVVLVDEKGKFVTINLSGISPSFFFRKRVLSYIQS